MKQRIVILSFLFFVLPCYSIVNTESLRSNYFKDGDVSQVDGHFQTRKGNDELWQLGTAIRYQFNHFTQNDSEENGAKFLKKTFFVISDFNLAERRDIIFMRNGLNHVRWIFMENRSWGHEYFLQHQFNSFLNLNTRLLVGSNLRFNIFQDRNDSLTLGLGEMVEYENLTSSKSSDDAQNTFGRFNSYLSFKQGRLKDLIQYSITFFYQPRNDYFQDYRLLLESEFQYKLTKMISLVLNINYYYDSRPPFGILKYDWQSIYKLRLRF